MIQVGDVRQWRLREDLEQAVPPADTPLLDEVPSVPNRGDSEAPFRFFR
jgi:hypothetical protein